MTAEERSEIARKAAHSRWSKESRKRARNKRNRGDV